MSRPKKEPEPKESAYEQILQLVNANPRAYLGCAELAELFRIPIVYVTAANGSKDTPFIGKNCHPDDFREWLKKHPGLTT